MSTISANDVAELRKQTGAGLMDCKKALQESNGDYEGALEYLRKKGQKVAEKRADKDATEGCVVTALNSARTTGVVLALCCETDFVAKNDDFLAMSAALAKMVAEGNPADVDALSAMPMNGTTVDEARKALIGKVGENLSLRRFKRVEAAGVLTSYVHGGAKVATLVDTTGGDTMLAKDVAMHIAATKPKALDSSGVPAEDIAKERSVAEAKAAESGKPAEIVAKMVDGSIAKFLKEVSLLSQPFVKDDKQTIEQLMKSKGAKVNSFTLYVVGEGIEKKVTDFAAEVAEQAAAAKAKAAA